MAKSFHVPLQFVSSASGSCVLDRLPGRCHGRELAVQSNAECRVSKIESQSINKAGMNAIHHRLWDWNLGLQGWKADSSIETKYSHGMFSYFYVTRQNLQLTV